MTANGDRVSPWSNENILEFTNREDLVLLTDFQIPIYGADSGRIGNILARLGERESEQTIQCDVWYQYLLDTSTLQMVVVPTNALPVLSGFDNQSAWHH